jgi:hypothetical protein
MRHECIPLYGVVRWCIRVRSHRMAQFYKKHPLMGFKRAINADIKKSVLVPEAIRKQTGGVTIFYESYSKSLKNLDFVVDLLSKGGSPLGGLTCTADL